MNKVRTRIAPSPTGEPHIGNFYSALLDYALAKKYKGQFIVRIEDTDRTRLIKGAEEKFYQALDWLGISEDESPRKGGPFKPYRQSKRLVLYQKYIQELLDKNAAYRCFCTPERLAQLRKDQQKRGTPPKYDRRCLALNKQQVNDYLTENIPFVVRLKIPEEGKTGFNDLIRGPITFENRLIDDQILLKSDGFPTYHLAVVVDDHLMKISHVIRAEEWISSTPKHILIYRSLGWEPPKFLHHPILRNPDRSKMSKRKNPTSVLWYRQQGFVPEALINYLTQLGWTHPEQKDIYSWQEFLEKFEIKNLKTTAPIFDLQKLEWMNGKYIRSWSASKLRAKLTAYNPKLKEIDKNDFQKAVLLVQGRMKKLSDFEELAGFLFKEPAVNLKFLTQKNLVGQEAVEALATIKKRLSLIDGMNWQSQLIENVCRDFITENKEWTPKKLFTIIRVAVTGQSVAPPLFATMEVLGKQKVLGRIGKIIVLL